MIKTQTVTNKQQWDDHVLDNGGHPLQLWGWGQVKASHGWKAERLFVVDEQDDDKIIGAAQVLVRRLPFPFGWFAYIPRGPIISGENGQVLTALSAFVKRQYKAVTLSIEPDFGEFEPPDGWRRSTSSILPAKTVLLDLEKTESDLLAVMSKKTRQYIRKSAAEGIQIKLVKSADDINKCLAIYHQTAKRANFNLHSDQYYLDVKAMLSDHSPIFAAFLDNEPIAFLWLAISETTAFELYGGMNEDGQRLRANYALKWHAIRKAKEWGLARYDFGGLITDGISTFKQGWSGEATVLPGTFDKPLSPFYVVWSKLLPGAKKLLQRLRR